MKNTEFMDCTDRVTNDMMIRMNCLILAFKNKRNYSKIEVAEQYYQYVLHGYETAPNVL